MSRDLRFVILDYLEDRISVWRERWSGPNKDHPDFLDELFSIRDFVRKVPVPSVPGANTSPSCPIPSHPSWCSCGGVDPYRLLSFKEDTGKG